ncbi:hypothetical protein ACSBR1_035233 [Camellia fascicularis]
MLPSIVVLYKYSKGMVIKSQHSFQVNFSLVNTMNTKTQPKFLQSPWPFFNYVNSPFLFNEFGDFGLAMDVDMDDDNFDFCPPFITTEDYSFDNSKISTFPIPTTLLDKFSDPQVHVKDSDIALPEDDFSISVEDFDIEVLSNSLKQSEESLQLTLPTENMELNNAIHLIKAYREAIDEGQIELSEVIMKRISEKVSPVVLVPTPCMQRRESKQRWHEKTSTSREGGLSWATAPPSFHVVIPC